MMPLDDKTCFYCFIFINCAHVLIFFNGYETLYNTSILREIFTLTFDLELSSSILTR